MITIGKNKALDAETYLSFRDFSVAGADFGKAIVKEHPYINTVDHIKYIDAYYEEHAEAIDASVAEINNLLAQRQGRYFKALKKYFGADYSGNNYTGYISIFNCNPRFLEDQTFQIYYRKDAPDKLEICFHEVAHFVFFDYCDKNLGEKIAGLDKNSGVFWELSEVFNVILLNQPEFRELLGREEGLFYPDLREKLNFGREIFSGGQTKSVSDFVKRYLKDVQ